MTASTKVEDNSDLAVDDIFNLLKKTQPQTQTQPVKNSKELTFDELKKKVSHLPSIEVRLQDEILKSKKIRNTSRGVLKINDAVNERIESVLPNSKDKIRTDKRLIKEEKTNKWFEIKKPELTDDLKRDLLIIKNRKYLDPKRFYRGEKWEIPENFQIGEIVSGVGEYAGKLKRKQKGESLVDELLKDKDTNTWFNKTYSEIQVKKKSGGKKFLQDKIAKRKHH